MISNFAFIIYYFGVSGAAIHFFITAGANPGFVDETISEDDKRMMELKMRTETSVDSEECETIDMGLDSSREICKSRQDLSTSLARGSKLKNFLTMRSVKKNVDASIDPEAQISSGDKDPESMEYITHVEMPAKRYCDVCNVEQPYRGRHCWECNRCIRKFDHHCFWIGGCVGELNHGKFFLFLLFQTWQEIIAFNIANDGHYRAVLNYPDSDNIEQK